MVGSWAFVDIDLSRIHGSYVPPQGYTFDVVPRDTLLTSLSTAVVSDVVLGDISSSYSIAKAVLSLVQALAAVVTLTPYKDCLINR